MTPAKKSPLLSIDMYEKRGFVESLIRLADILDTPNEVFAERSRLAREKQSEKKRISA
jgi:hypothetical protein